MILHLGGDIAVPLKDIIAIFDMPSALKSDVNREFLEVAREEGFIKEVSKGENKTFVLAETKNKTVIYISPISSATLLKRNQGDGSFSCNFLRKDTLNGVR